MGSVVKLTIGGMDVPGGRYGDHAFRRPLGVGAPEMIWCLPPYIAEAILAQEWTEISIQQQGAATSKTFKKVKVVCEAPSDHPLRRYVVLSDARWEIHRKYVKENYNLRTSSAETELLKVDGVPIEIDPVRTIVLYAASSLKGGRVPWSADDILDDVLTRALGVKYTKLSRSMGAYAPNDVQLDGPGNIALAHALGHAGGLDVRINDDGDFELVDAQLGAEKATIEAYVTYALRNMGLMRWIRLPNVAPTGIRVGFDADVEVRGDGYLAAPGSAVSIGKIDWPTFDNVIQVTDLQLSTRDAVSGKSYTAVQGSYLPVDQWFTAVAADTVVPAPQVPAQVTWSRAFANRDYMRGLMEFWYVTGQTGGLEPSYAWANRYRAYREHYLKTWRLNPAFARLCLPGSIRAVRARLLDPANQTRQPSPVYMDHARRPSIRGVRDEKQFGWNVHCVPGTPSGQAIPTGVKTYSDTAFPDEVFPLTSCIQAPLVASCLDNVSGIFKLALRRDTHDHVQEMVPALVQKLPTNDLDQVNRGAGLAYWEDCSLVQTQRVVMIFTAVPASAPLYFVDVTPAQALARLNVNVQIAPKGPVFELRVGPALQSARICYTDADRNAIMVLFGTGDKKFAQSLLQAFSPLNLEILKDYAQAVSAVLYAAMLDHYEGECEIGFSPDAMPIGSLQCVTHVVTAKGRLYTAFGCKGAQPPFQPIHFMERGARAVIFRSPGNYQ